MTETKTANIDEWVTRIQKTRSARDLLVLLAEFRTLEWTDLERQKVSHTYMKVLETILKASSENLKKKGQASAGADGPVWYEKM